MPSSSSKPRSSGPVLRSLSPSGRLQSAFNGISSSASDFASYTSSSFYSSSAPYFGVEDNQHHRPSSPTRVNLCSSNSLASSFRFSIDRSVSPGRHNHIVKSHNSSSIPVAKRTCMCSPTSHPGSFRCSLHKNAPNGGGVSYPTTRLNMRRSAMTNSLVRIGGVEGEWVKRALTALIRPSSHHQKRREGFEPKPSRLSVMSKAGDDL